MLSYYQLERCVEEHMQKMHVPAAALAIVNTQGILYANGFGMTSVERGGAPVSTQTLFRIGSVTKPMLSTAVMRLVEMRELELDRPLQEYDRELRFRAPYTGGEITVRMLLSHMSGLPADSFDDDGHPHGLERYIREQLPLYHFVAPPGTLYSYANAGFNLLGYLVQRMGKKPFPDLMQELVFDPLEMRCTTFDPRLVLTYPFALPHRFQNETLQVIHRTTESSAYAPSGGAYSTVLDLANFLLMHLQHGSFRDRPFLSESSIRQMHSQHTSRQSVNKAGYGLGFELFQYRDQICLGHSGSMSSFGAQIILLPEKQLAFALLVNRIAGMQRLVKAILDQILDAPKERMTPRTTQSEQIWWTYYTGIYVGLRVGIAEVKVEDEQFVLILNAQRIPLFAHTRTVYFGYWPGSDIWVSVGFLLNEQSPEPVRYIMIDEQPCERFEASVSPPSDPASWTRFTGTYQEREGNHETISISLENQQLRLQLRDNDGNVIEGVCLPLDEARFAWQRGMITFTIAEDGTIPSLTALGVYLFERV